MAFDLGRQLRQHNNSLLQQLFLEQGELLDFPWSTLKKSDVKSIVHGISSISAGKRREIQSLLQRIAMLSDSRGLRVIHEELAQRCPTLVPEWKSQKNRADQVLWVYLNARKVFDEAAIFARADALSTTRYFNRWSQVLCDNVEVTPERVEILRQSLKNYSKDKLREEHCEVSHHKRLNGDEYFFAYLPDWPNNFDVFTDEGALHSLDLPTAFTIVFAFEPTTGVLEMIASGGISVQQQLRRLFYKSICQLDVDNADPDKPQFALDHLLQSGFRFETEPADGIETVTVTQILLIPLVEVEGIDGLMVRFNKRMTWPDSIRVVDDLLGSRDLSRDQVAVDNIQIRMQLFGDGTRRGKPLTLRVSPRTSNLKSVDDEQIQFVADRCLRKWGIINA